MGRTTFCNFPHYTPPPIRVALFPHATARLPIWATCRRPPTRTPARCQATFPPHYHALHTHCLPSRRTLTAVGHCVYAPFVALPLPSGSLDTAARRPLVTPPCRTAYHAILRVASHYLVVPRLARLVQHVGALCCTPLHHDVVLVVNISARFLCHFVWLQPT